MTLMDVYNHKVVSRSSCGSLKFESYKLLYAGFYSYVSELTCSTSTIHSPNTPILKTIDKGKSDAAIIRRRVKKP